MSAPDTKLAIIRKLLAQAEDEAVTEAEAAAFMAKAADLMARYGVDRAMLADGDPAADAIGDREIGLDAPFALDKFDLLSKVAHALGLRAVRRIRFAENGAKLVLGILFGYASDIERTEILFTSLLVQANRGLACARVPRGEHKAAYRRAWLAGFGAVIYHRLREAEEHVRRQATADARTSAAGRSAAVVLADRGAIVDRRFAETFPQLRHLGPRQLSGGGGWAGAEAGQRADLGGARVGAGGGRRRLG